MKILSFAADANFRWNVEVKNIILPLYRPEWMFKLQKA